jgi:eukaryotic-like serine/threonine-protein kinase
MGMDEASTVSEDDAHEQPLAATLPHLHDLESLWATLDLSAGQRRSLLHQTTEGSAPAVKGEAAAGGPERADTRYLVEGQVGQGGMGTILLARDRDLGRVVAMKQLKAAVAKPRALRRFLLEAQVTGQLEHPGVIPVHDLGVTQEGRPYYTMKYVRGNETLRQVIDRLDAGNAEYHKRYTLERRVRVIQQIAQTLHFAHVKGVIHRDLKPANIMLGPFGEVYLMDWGVAKLEGSEAKAVDPADESGSGDGPDSGERIGVKTSIPMMATQEGSLVGTPLYMAPEQLRGRPTARSDVYSLVAVLYELLCLRHHAGEPPPETVGELGRRLQSGPKPAEDYTHRAQGLVPRTLSLLCQRGLDPDPEQRFQTAGELEQALQDWVEGNDPVVCPTTLAMHGLQVWRRALTDHPKLATYATYLGLGLGLGSVLLLALILAGVL